jgi:CO/xanthine dehydrogenase Mo-binding subunit
VAETAIIGQSLPRIDGGEKVAGLTRYAGDVPLPGLLHARLVVSPHAHARITRVDTRAAAAVPGVVRVFTGQELPLAKPDPSSRNRAPLAVDRVVFNGHPVVAVVAEAEAIAEDAAALVEIEYEELPVVTDPVEAMRPEAPRVRERAEEGEGDEEELGMHGAEQGSRPADESAAPNVVSTVKFVRGDVSKGFAEADVVVENRYVTSMVHQGYLEPRAARASIDSLGNVTVWTATQALFFTRAEVAKTLGLPERRVRVVATPLGGGFGGKFVLVEPLAAALAVALHRPVSLVMTRTEEFLATTPAPGSVFEMKTGITRDGRLAALQARVIFDAGAYSGAPVGIACLLLGGNYRVPHLDIRGYEVRTHKPGPGAYRAPGAVQAAFAMESQMDEMARRIAMDPLELRLRNAVVEGDLMTNDRPWPRIGLRECLETLREERRHRPKLERDGARSVRRGVGVAVGGWPGGVEPATAVCRLNTDGTLSVVLGTVDMSGTNTGMAQIAAESFGLPTGSVEVVNADTDAAPYAGASGGSKITYTVGAAVKQAAEHARQQLFAIAADHLEAAPQDLELVDGHVRVRGVPGRALAVAKIAELSMQFGAKYEPVFGRGSTATVARAPGFAVHLTEVEVETETGAVRVLDHLVVQDVGRALNPAAIDGQIRGAVAQGVGWALYERLAYDEYGRLQSATLMDYTLPRVEQVPSIRSVLVEVPAALGPFGAKGVGEPPVIGAAAAIANAVADATGVRVTELPIRSEELAQRLRG